MVRMRSSLPMALTESLLTAIVRADADALVMHVDEKPYVVASAGPIELSSEGLNLQAMAVMVAKLLPAELQRALIEFGAVEHELPALHGDRFTVVVARGGDDVWIEIRRHRRSRPGAAPNEAGEVESHVVNKSPQVTAPRADAPREPVALAPFPQTIEAAAGTEPAIEFPWMEPAGAGDEIPAPSAAPEAARFEPTVSFAPEHEVREPPEPLGAPLPATVGESVAPVAESEPMTTTARAASEHQPSAQSEPTATPEPVAEMHVEIPIPPQPEPQPPNASPQASSTSVTPMTRTLRIDVPRVPSRPLSARSGTERLLGIAAARGATALYLTTQAPPFLRVDDDVQVLEGEPPMTSTAVEAAVLELMPETMHDASRRGDPTEWVSELAEIGRVRCSTFRDYRGPGAIFQLSSFRPVSAAQLGLNPEIQALATETEGLVLVASPRGHGKSTLVSAFVDLINHQRSGYIITLEGQIRLVHEDDRALISQREVRGTADQVLNVTRAALTENADVLVIDDLLSAEVFQLALEAAGSGRLVIASLTGPSITAALTRIVELFPSDQRKDIQSLLAERLRGAVAQVLLRKAAGGRIAAREVVLATSAVGRVLAEGQLSDLPLAIDSGRKHGLVSLTDSLVQLVRGGVVDAREAYRKADDRQTLLLALKRENVDTSLLERLA